MDKPKRKIKLLPENIFLRFSSSTWRPCQCWYWSWKERLWCRGLFDFYYQERKI